MKRKVFLLSLIIAMVFSFSAAVSADTDLCADSGWILSSQAPSGAKITAEKWTYDQKVYQESQSSSMSGWTLESSYWKQSNSGSFYYASFPSASYYSTSDQYYKSYNKSPYTGYETSTAKRVVSTKVYGYIFYHWAFPDTTFDGDNYVGDYYGEWGPAHTTQAKVWESFFSTSGGTASSHIDSTGTRYVYKFPGHSNHSYWWFRINLNQCSYTDYVKVFKYYKSESKESMTPITASSVITNVKHWVKVGNTVNIKFADVSGSAWYASYVNELVALGILNGKTATIFDPEGTIIRAEFAKILAVASGENLSAYDGASKFSDCTNHWAKKYINWAAAKGIVTGVGNGKFDPNAKITREALCTMIWRYAKYKGIYPEKVCAPISFSDDGSISAWAREAVYIMQKAGVISGKGGNRFDPQGNAKRCECAKVVCVYRKCKNDTAACNNLKGYRNKFSGYGHDYNFFLADLTHDGIDDLIVTYRVGAYKSSMLEVYTMAGGSLRKIFSNSTPITGFQNTYWLMRNSNGSSLMVYQLDYSCGQAVQSLEVFSFDSWGNKKYSYKDDVSYYFDGSPKDVGIPQKFYTVKNTYEQYSKKSELLIESNDIGLKITSSPYNAIFSNLGN